MNKLFNGKATGEVELNLCCRATPTASVSVCRLQGLLLICIFC